jgi:hypothetical protein
MKQFLNIDENERRRILEMHENATKKHYLIEQSSTAYTFSNESKPAKLFIYKEFNLFKSNPNFATMTPQQQLEAVKVARQQLDSVDMNELVQKAQQAGVSTESILALQEDLKNVSGDANLSFVSSTGGEKGFADGKLGTNTVAALLDYQIYLLGKQRDDRPATKQSYVEPGSAKTAIQGTYKVGQQ